ncbi:MAG: Na+/H+ antiporter NhaA [Acidimicrobiales bacterium]
MPATPPNRGRHRAGRGAPLWSRFLRTETGSAAVVLVAALAALAWANIAPPSYTHVWQTTLSVRSKVKLVWPVATRTTLHVTGR